MVYLVVQILVTPDVHSFNVVIYILYNIIFATIELKVKPKTKELNGHRYKIKSVFGHFPLYVLIRLMAVICRGVNTSREPYPCSMLTCNIVGK